MWCHFSCFQGDCWSFPAAGPSGDDACTLPGIEFHPPKHSLLFVPYVWNMQPGLSPVTISLPHKPRHEGLPHSRDYICFQGGSRSKAENLTWLVLVLFFLFNQVKKTQTSTARAGSEFLLTVSFSPLKIMICMSAWVQQEQNLIVPEEWWEIIMFN